MDVPALQSNYPGMRTVSHSSGFPYWFLTDLDVEPFDEALDRHIWSLSDQRLKWDKEVADRRRSRPGEIEKLLTEGLARHHACDAEMPDNSEPYADLNGGSLLLNR